MFCFVLFCWWPTSCINQGKQADKLHTISMYSSKAQWLLRSSLCSDALMLPHMSHLLLVACPDNSADCNQAIKYQQSSLYVMNMFWRSAYLSVQSPRLTWTKWPSVPFSSLSFLCENASSVLLGEWTQHTVPAGMQVPACIPSKCFFSFPENNWGIILFYLSIQGNSRRKLGFGLLCCVLTNL